VNAVVCKCGKVFTELDQLKGVRVLGLALVGECPNCSQVLGVNRLWKLKHVIDEKEGNYERIQPTGKASVFSASGA